jgi:hypothetical protein
LQVFLRADGSPTFASSPVRSIQNSHPLAPSLSNSSVKHDIDIRVVLESFYEMAVEPWMSARDDKQIAHG